MHKSTLHCQSKLFALPALAGSVEHCMAQSLVRTKNSANGPDSTHLGVDDAVQKTNEAPSEEVPSDSVSEASNSVSLALSATPLSQVDVPADDEFDDSREMLESTTEDGGRREYWDTVSHFASDMTGAAKMALLERGKTFKKVVAVIVYWETSTRLDHLRDEANRLEVVFRDKFNYEVLVYKLAKDVTTRHFIARITNELDKVSNDEDSLFILYYGGHASIDFPNARSWKKESSSRSPEVSWSTAETALFMDGAICNKFFIFDCCDAGGMIDQDLAWESSCELLGACAADVQASALKSSSFTTAFIEEISNSTYSVCELHAALCSFQTRTKYSLKAHPHYQNFTNHRNPFPPTLIQKVGSPSESDDRLRSVPETLERLNTITDAVICIAVTFKCSAQAFMEELQEVKKDWKRWFKFAPTACDDVIINACHSGPQLLAVFDSNSCITIWSFPIWLWDYMAPPSGYRHIGIIRPQNLALGASTTQGNLAAPEYSSEMIVGEISPGLSVRRG